MKLLIIYSSKNGCAEECAKLLKKQTDDNFDVEICDLAHSTPDLDSCDFAVVGGGIRFSKFHKPLRDFLKHSGKELEKKPHALFLCCAYMDRAEEYMKALYPKSLSDSAVCTEFFGGQLKVDKHKGIWKIIIRMVRNSFSEREDPLPIPDIIESNISLLASKIVLWRKDMS